MLSIYPMQVTHLLFTGVTVGLLHTHSKPKPPLGPQSHSYILESPWEQRKNNSNDKIVPFFPSTLEELQKNGNEAFFLWNNGYPAGLCSEQVYQRHPLSGICSI